MLALGFAFAPLLWINSVMTMDYMWALTFLMGAYLALLYGAPQLAGLSLGLAAGFRLTSLFMLPSFWLLPLAHEAARRDPAADVTTLAVTLAAYTLVLMNYGLNFLNFYDQKVPLEEFIKRLGKDGLGIIGGLAVLVGAGALAAAAALASRATCVHDPHVLIWTAAIVRLLPLVHAAAARDRLPDPALPVRLLPDGALHEPDACWSSRWRSIVLAGFVDITSPDDTTGIEREHVHVGARIGQGHAAVRLDTLQNQMDFAHEVRD